MKALLLAPAVLLAASAASAQESAAGRIEPDGTVVVPSFRLPPSAYTSEEARAKLPRTVTDPEASMHRRLAEGRAPEARAAIGRAMAPLHAKFRAIYPVTVTPGTIAGVPSVTFMPQGGVPAANRGKVLLNLPGGGFVMGSAEGTGTSESIPLAALDKVKVISITYRQAPEHVFPAASEDVAKVYRELLKTHKPQDIGIYGCSAGGTLTAQAIARFIKDGLPLPGAIGIFCASADARKLGDSRAWGNALQGLGPRETPRQYIRPQDETNPLASPILDPQMLRRFPPTLLISAVRAGELSATVNTHRELVKAGVEADLHVWDGLGHAFFLDPDLPETREAFEVQAAFFRKYLGLAR